jgi:hypothetical protein
MDKRKFIKLFKNVNDKRKTVIVELDNNCSIFAHEYRIGYNDKVIGLGYEKHFIATVNLKNIRNVW